LLAQLDATVTSAPELAARIAIVRADHVAHVDAITSLLVNEGVVISSGTETTGASFPTPSSIPSSTPSTPPHAPFVDLAGWVAAETTAAASAASASTQSAGVAAATLASISACESSHAAWLA
jgi:hypothetical protein